MAEIRQHSWFLTKLPRYLAIPPRPAVDQFKNVSRNAVVSVHLFLFSLWVIF